MAVEGRTVSHCYILVNRKFIDFMSPLRHGVWFSFSVKQFPSAELGIATQGCQLSRIIRETPHFKPFLPVSRLESEISRIITEVCHFL